MRIGLLGGTFNPPHIGHLVLAEECWYRLSLDKVVFIPSFLPPHKDDPPEISPADRLNMLRLALEGFARYEISTYEIDKGGRSYTVDTVRYFRRSFGASAELFFLTGADSGKNLGSWKDIEEVLSEVKFVIATRPGWDAGNPYEEKTVRLEMPAVDVSSSFIRDRIRSAGPIDHYVPAGVAEFIRRKGLYR